MSSPVSEEWRSIVKSRADNLCEYCLIHEDDCFFTLQIDHIISLKHGGASALENLAAACIYCNRSKGSDAGSIAVNGGFSRFFNPRLDHWAEHFKLQGGIIESATPIGEATARIFQFNNPERVNERDELIAQGRYPTFQALARMSP